MTHPLTERHNTSFGRYCILTVVFILISPAMLLLEKVADILGKIKGVGR
jgi:hypothetical protein